MSDNGEGQAVEVEAAVEVEEKTALPARREPARRELVAGLLRPVAEPQEVLAAQEETRALVEQALQDGRDYGKIPGTGKPTLLKPGAERINAAFGVCPRYRIDEREIDHDREVQWTKRKKRFENGRFMGWEEESGVSNGLYRYVVECELVHRESGVPVGQGLASCSTMESKYIDRPRDSENTVLKMAEKRALIAATLNAYGLSDQFTQDVEDVADYGATSRKRSGRPKRKPKQEPKQENEDSTPSPKRKVWDLTGRWYEDTADRIAALCRYAKATDAVPDDPEAWEAEHCQRALREMEPLSDRAAWEAWITDREKVKGAERDPKREEARREALITEIREIGIESAGLKHAELSRLAGTDKGWTSLDLPALEKLRDTLTDRLQGVGAEDFFTAEELAQGET